MDRRLRGQEQLVRCVVCDWNTKWLARGRFNNRGRFHLRSCETAKLGCACTRLGVEVLRKRKATELKQGVENYNHIPLTVEGLDLDATSTRDSCGFESDSCGSVTFLFGESCHSLPDECI